MRASDKNLFKICAIYRSPCSNSSNDCELFQLLSTLESSTVGRSILIGDFNFPNINWDSCTAAGSNTGTTQSHKFLSSVQKNFLTQHVLFPTRIRGIQTPHILDLVLTYENVIDQINSLSPLGKSDHCILHVVCDLECSVIDSNTVKYNFNKFM